MENKLLHEILAAREQRVRTQKTLLEKHQKPLLCFTMNIPGPDKYDRDVSIGFSVGNWLLADALPRHRLLHFSQNREITGCVAYYVVDMPARQLKEIAIALEDMDPIGRVFDMDVLDTDGRKLSREELGHPRRKCLLCDEDAVLCARSRSHELSQLKHRTGFLLYIAAREEMCEYIASRAYYSLNEEVSTTPKPGLVDRNNRGSHRDMGIKHFFASANALRPFFFQFAETGFLTRDDAPEETFRQIRSIGIAAEEAMRKATGGVNTHKGAIFSMGLCCAAAGRITPEFWSAERLLQECAAMTKGITARELACVTLENAKSPGERIYAQYGVTGVRGQAEAGFPAVMQVGLPIFREGLSRGLNMNDAGCCALLHLLAVTDDTNLIHRSDRDTQLKVKAQVAAMLEKDPFPNKEVLEELDAEFIRKDLSPGGSADLLALTYFLFLLS